MLHTLHIENVAVIRKMNLSFSRGLSVLTGETGAGKSILIDSLVFLTGGKGGKDLIRSGESSASVSALFSEIGKTGLETAERLGVWDKDEESEPEFLIERTVGKDGRSAARINGKPVTIGMLREFGTALLAVHGQHDSLRILREEDQRSAVDTFAADGDLLIRYSKIFEELSRVRSEKQRLLSDESERLRLCEILSFQIRDIDGKKLKNGEEELLEAERLRLRSMEKIVKQVHTACRLLTDREDGNVTAMLSRAAASVGQLESVLPKASELRERLTELSYEITDLSERIREFAPDQETDPMAKLDRIEGRLEVLSRLKKKYGSTISEVLEFRKQAAQRLEELQHSDEKLAELERQETVLADQAASLAGEITQVRKKAAGQISGEMIQTLAFLDMPKVRFEISVEPASLGESGGDHISFLLAANPGEPLLPMSDIASGGELSRIMLALSDVLHGSCGADTVIYDEIDTGISGSTSRKVGIKLKSGTVGRQTLCVTHSAQIASLADKHYFLFKSETAGRTETSVKILEGEEQVDEIARILGGIRVTEAQRAAAVDMIREGREL